MVGEMTRSSATPAVTAAQSSEQDDDRQQPEQPRLPGGQRLADPQQARVGRGLTDAPAPRAAAAAPALQAGAQPSARVRPSSLRFRRVDRDLHAPVERLVHRIVRVRRLVPGLALRP